MELFIEEFGDEEAWRRRGWKMVEKVSVLGKRAWANLLKGVRDGGRGELLNGDYSRVALLVVRQEVFRFNYGFLGRVKRCRDLKGMKGLLGKTWNGLGMGHFNRLECSNRDFSEEAARNNGCRHEVDLSGPRDCEV